MPLFCVGKDRVLISFAIFEWIFLIRAKSLELLFILSFITINSGINREIHEIGFR
jgi:hypothetical protein